MPLFSEPTPSLSLGDIIRGRDVPRIVKATASAGSHNTTNTYLTPIGRNRQWWLLDPILSEPKADLVRVAILVRLLQVIGVAVAPVRWTVDITRFVFRMFSDKKQSDPRKLAVVAASAITITTTTYASLLLPADWAVLASATLDTVQHQITLYLAAGDRALQVRWMARVVWGTGAELAAVFLPPRDATYRRAEVAALMQVLRVVEAVRGAAIREAAAARTASALL